MASREASEYDKQMAEKARTGVSNTNTQAKTLPGPSNPVGIGGAPTRATTLPTNGTERKTYPVASGLMDYFPDALAAVAHVSWKGNEQHNPGQPLHWARGKSADEADTMLRHFLERGGKDTDGIRHSAKMAWRALALLQKEIEAEAVKPLPLTSGFITTQRMTDVGMPVAMGSAGIDQRIPQPKKPTRVCPQGGGDGLCSVCNDDEFRGCAKLALTAALKREAEERDRKTLDSISESAPQKAVAGGCGCPLCRKNRGEV